MTMEGEDRAVRALTDVVAVEKEAPGLVRVVTWGGAYLVDARDGGCRCPDKQYNEPARCKHEQAAILATSDNPTPFIVSENLDARAMADGGRQHPEQWEVVDHDNNNRKRAESRQDAEDKAGTAREFGSDHVEILAPNDNRGALEAESDADQSEDPATVVDPDDHASVPDEEYADLPDRSVGDDPIEWVPGDFVDEIDGTQAINRKGFEVLSHFYDINVESDVQVAPEDTSHEYARVKAVATTPDGRTCEAHGSAHVDRDDDHYLLLEMADTRARKRALSVATGVGAVAVEELKSEVQG